MKIDPKSIKGNWTFGWALDVHTLSSMPIGPNEFGHMQFDNTYSEIGEAIFKLKYRNDKSQVNVIAQVVTDFIKSKSELSDLCAICFALPSDTSRAYQPVLEIAKVVGNKCGIAVPLDYLQKIKQTPMLKNEIDSQKRRDALQGAFRIVDERYAGKHILVFDDLYRSGETLKAICETLVSQGKVGKIFVITATQTRSKR